MTTDHPPDAPDPTAEPVINVNVGMISCDCGADFYYWSYTNCPQCGRSYESALTELADAGHTIRRRATYDRTEE